MLKNDRWIAEQASLGMLKPFQEKIDKYNASFNLFTKDKKGTNSIRNFRDREIKLSKQIEPIRQHLIDIKSLHH